MVTQLFADENKRRGHGFVLVAVEYQADAVKQARAQLSAHCRSGQLRIHFKSEDDQTRARVVKLLHDQGVSAHVFTAQSRYEPQARADCIEALGQLAVSSGANRLVIERDETRESADRTVLTRLMQRAPHRVPWEVLPPTSDALLWSADAVAWCWTNPKPYWRRAVTALIVSQTQV